MVTNETLLHKNPKTGEPQVIGLGWLDDSMTEHGPTEEDRNYVADTGAHADDIKAMYILGENPAMSDPDVTHARAALAKLDHLVVQDIFVTEPIFLRMYLNHVVIGGVCILNTAKYIYMVTFILSSSSLNI